MFPSPSGTHGPERPPSPRGAGHEGGQGYRLARLLISILDERGIDLRPLPEPGAGPAPPQAGPPAAGAPGPSVLACGGAWV